MHVVHFALHVMHQDVAFLTQYILFMRYLIHLHLITYLELIRAVFPHAVESPMMMPDNAAFPAAQAGRVDVLHVHDGDLLADVEEAFHGLSTPYVSGSAQIGRVFVLREHVPGQCIQIFE